jgi:hypothetical protein
MESAPPARQLRFKAEPTELIEGFIADELLAFAPSAVSATPVVGGEEEAKGFVDNAKLVPLLWEAVKELAAETRRLTATVEQLTQQLDMTAPAALRMTAEYHSLM